MKKYFRKNILIAGATRSGKSAFMETFIVETAQRHSPEEVRLFLVDPKRVQLLAYSELPHVIEPVIFEAEKAKEALSQVWDEALKRIRNPQLNGVPVITVVIDEIADFMIVEKEFFESMIEKITALSDASNTFIVLSTARPDGTVILTPRLRACFPERLIFRIHHPDDARILMGDDRATTLTEPGSAYWCDIRSNTIDLVSVPHIGSADREAAVRKMVQERGK